MYNSHNECHEPLRYQTFEGVVVKCHTLGARVGLLSQ